ncbi:MAG: hypothetical protein ACFE9I_04270 [Candidatus Hermodarchaeota archaeon]
MNLIDKIERNSIPSEVIGKYFALNKAQDKQIQGWITINKSLKEFIKSIKEEIEYEWDLERIFIENYLMFYINTDDNAMIEIKDDKTLNALRRNKKIFIVILDKMIPFKTIKDIPILHKWYLDNLVNYDI